MFSFIMIILTLITSYKVFEKYGKPGWHGLVPFLNQYEEYGLVWNSSVGLTYIVLSLVSGVLQTIAKNSGSIMLALLTACISIACFVINLMFATKKSKAFDGKLGLTLALIFFPFFANLYIGFSANCQYVGNMSEF